MRRVMLKCSLFGGLVVYLWYMFSWMVLPWHDMVMHRFTDQEAVAKVIMQNAPINGVYVLPSMKPPVENPMMQQSMMDQTETPSSEMAEAAPQADQGVAIGGWTGPFVHANVVLGGIRMDHMTRPLLVALLTQLIGAGLITWLLLQSKLTRYWPRVRFVTVVGFVVAFLSYIPLWNWWGFTAGYTLVGIFDHTLAWFFGGLVIAKLSKH